MNLKIKIFLYLMLILCSLSLISIFNNFAYSPDSFSQKVGDEFIWQVYEEKPGVVVGMPDIGGQLKLRISIINRTVLSSKLYDTVYGLIYMNSKEDQTWVLITPTNWLEGAYNSTYGIPPNVYYAGGWVIPHNESAVRQSSLTFWSIFFSTVKWNSGSNGYDGTLSAWKCLATGGTEKLEIKYNENGVVQYIKKYSDTGNGWELTFDLELLGISSINVFLMIPIICTLAIIIAIVAIPAIMLLRKKFGSRLPQAPIQEGS